MIAWYNFMSAWYNFMIAWYKFIVSMRCVVIDGMFYNHWMSFYRVSVAIEGYHL